MILRGQGLSMTNRQEDICNSRVAFATEITEITNQELQDIKFTFYTLFTSLLSNFYSCILHCIFWLVICSCTIIVKCKKDFLYTLKLIHNKTFFVIFTFCFYLYHHSILPSLFNIQFESQFIMKSYSITKHILLIIQFDYLVMMKSYSTTNHMSSFNKHVNNLILFLTICQFYRTSDSHSTQFLFKC